MTGTGTGFVPDVNRTLELLKSIDDPDRVVEDPTVYKTQSGVVLKIRSVPPFLIRDAQARIPEPVPPRVHIVDKGPDVYEENPNDPKYVRDVEAYQMEIGEIANALMLVRGTSIQTVPEGISKLEDTDWSDDAKEFGGIDVPATGRRRYYCWVKYVALEAADDFLKLIRLLSGYSGQTLEVDVAAAAASFRPEPEGDTSGGVHLVPQDERGDSDTVPPRASS